MSITAKPATRHQSLAEPLHLPCGAVLRNRLAKAAMTEGLADAELRATARHERLYRLWSASGAGLLLTGNVQIDHTDLERPGNVAIDVTQRHSVDADARRQLQRFAAAGTTDGNHLWMQIAHAGRQSPRYVTRQPVAPSAVRLDILGNYARPRALREDEILDLIRRFGAAAGIARESGFTGVQVHGAHGYLISSFLSPVTNRRTDAWGGTLENRARFLLECVRSTRRAVGTDFPVSVKLNSDDFRRGGFTSDECLEVVRWLNDESVDLLEISGGTYEQPRLIGHAGRDDTALELRPSTLAREAYFLDYAVAIRTVARMPLMLTGGFRTRAAMESALGSTACDVIGIARPLIYDPAFPQRLLAREIDGSPRIEDTLYVRRSGWLSATSPLMPMRILNVFGEQSWYYCQIFRLADGRPIDRDRRILSSLVEYLGDEYSQARRLRRAHVR